MKFILALAVMMTSFIVSAQTKIVSIDAFDFSYTGGLLLKKDNGYFSKTP